VSHIKRDARLSFKQSRPKFEPRSSLLTPEKFERENARITAHAVSDPDPGPRVPFKNLCLLLSCSNAKRLDMKFIYTLASLSGRFVFSSLTADGPACCSSTSSTTIRLSSIVWRVTTMVRHYYDNCVSHIKRDAWFNSHSNNLVRT